MFLQPERKKNIRYFIQELNKQIFEISLVNYLLFYLLDDLFNKIISNYFNLNVLLIIVIISGVVLNLPDFAPEKKELRQKPVKIKDYLLITALGLIAVAIIYYKLNLELWLRLAISIITGIIIILLSILLLNEDNEQNI